MRMRRLVFAIALAAGVGAIGHAWRGGPTGGPPRTRPFEDGRRLFDGSLPAAARLAGHDDALPPVATRCANCHADVDRAGQASFAPALTASRLLDSRVRRGGPASAYDETSFCRVLRDGIGPDDVMINETMPRYTLTRDQCATLWRYLTQAT
ncbi:hypothetical protein Bsp3421_002914 [Burkholderia sp. FERM BP-3421]|jgi:hypothetical protein|uniref:hypothetical protein n=1 Tax=Burkholderia sp. FERM BP-3421 TaxID=1494466 RepID=UPI00236293BC|nr:hypothetical protein [Burkholderia sp. FERM BP-3421]WDD92878.1 hypothetical protein Bsp3421_002914 [Burkholderia sp. FERM BP-3421]